MLSPLLVFKLLPGNAVRDLRMHVIALLTSATRQLPSETLDSLGILETYSFAWMSFSMP